MSGNVYEWCADAWHPDYQVSPTDGSPWLDDKMDHLILRGGSWSGQRGAIDCRVAHRWTMDPNREFSSFGFRLAHDY